MSDDFYLRYYQGHHGKWVIVLLPHCLLRSSPSKPCCTYRWGHEFIEFEFRPDGRLRYANNSNYKNDDIITREVFVSQAILDEVKRIVQDSEVVKEDDNQWPEPDRVGRQELEVIVDGKHISFTCTKLGSVLQVQQSKDPEGLRVFYYLVQDQPPAQPPPGPVQRPQVPPWGRWLDRDTNRCLNLQRIGEMMMWLTPLKPSAVRLLGRPPPQGVRDFLKRTS
ncbi:hypothetical protein QJQ45_000619 [Haematococcus lacustris]|nr:hypothetical protein QJQ45_000619 [Haematococcus lacustris]